MDELSDIVTGLRNYLEAEISTLPGFTAPA